MNVLRHLKITIHEPFSGGILRVCDGAKQVLPAISLPSLKAPSYEGISKELADYDRAHRQKDGYILEFTRDDLPVFEIKYLLNASIEGDPKENIKVEFTTELV